MEPFIRSVDFRMVEDSGGRILEGYAAVFDSPTVINSWEGDFVEVIERGAFARTVRSNPKPVLQFDHGTHPLVGGLPIGAIQELREDEQGLYVRARLHDNWLIQPVREAISEGSLTGMSFKFTIPDGGVTITRDSGDVETHTLTDVDLHELGPVVWPAYTDTSVGVRSKELADILTNDSDARAVIAAGLYGTPEQDLAVRSTDESEEPTDETTDDETSVHEPVRSDDETEPTVTTGSKTHRVRRAELVKAISINASKHRIKETD